MIGEKGILLLRRLRNKPCFSGKHFSHGTDGSRNPFDAVDYGIAVVCKDNVAVFSHQFHGQGLPAQIAHFIKMFDLKFNDPFQGRLRDQKDSASCQMLSKKHAKRRSL